MSSFLNGLKSIYKIGKQNGAGFFQGIKKGIKLGREVIDISKSAYDRINNISPEVGNILRPLIKNKVFERLDTGLQAADNSFDIIGKTASRTKGLNASNILPVNKEKFKKINDQGKDYADAQYQEQQALDIVNNGGYKRF